MGGFPKPLLWFDGERFVERLIGAYREAGVEHVVVVVGHEADEVIARADLADVTVCRNADYEEGMLSSVRAGVRATRELGVDGMFLSPVDYPLIPSGVLRTLADAFDTDHADADVVHPVHEGERGHPPLFAASTFDALLAAPDDEGARAVVYADETDTRDVPVDDERIFVDIDTPSEYWEAVKRYE